jgi:hypothetical protein
MKESSPKHKGFTHDSTSLFSQLPYKLIVNRQLPWLFKCGGKICGLLLL